MIEILKEKNNRTLDGGEESYVTVKFSGHHETFNNVETVRTFRLPFDKPQDAFLLEEYNRWFDSFDATAEF